MAVIGLAVSIFALVISFVPPSQLTGQNAAADYLTILIISFAVVIFIPFIIYHFMRKKNPLPPGVKMPQTHEASAENAAPADDSGSTRTAPHAVPVGQKPKEP